MQELAFLFIYMLYGKYCGGVHIIGEIQRLFLCYSTYINQQSEADSTGSSAV